MGTLSAVAQIASLRVQYDPELSSRAGEQAVRPVLHLMDDMVGAGQVVEVSFDELSHTLRNYSYTLVHLTSDGRPDGLSSTEYLRGFPTADITDYTYSFNTHQLYTHYRFTFPSEDMQPLISGAYAILIYEDARVEQPVAQVVIDICEDVVPISAKVRYDTSKGLSTQYQQLDVDVSTAGLSMQSPTQLTLVVEQNGRTDNAVRLTRPSYVEPHRLRYLNMPSLIFDGGQEYRHLDISSEYVKGAEVDRIHFVQGDSPEDGYQVLLFPSALRNGGYSYEPDANGIWLVHRERSDEADIEADYMWVHFFLPAREPWLDGGVYVLGDAWQNRLDATTRMHYDEQAGGYVWRTYLKQGGYEWLYAFYNTRQGTLPASLQRVEGNYWQTHNTYRIKAYFRGVTDRYDRLVGVQDIEN